MQPGKAAAMIPHTVDFWGDRIGNVDSGRGGSMGKNLVRGTPQTGWRSKVVTVESEIPLQLSDQTNGVKMSPSVGA